MMVERAQMVQVRAVYFILPLPSICYVRQNDNFNILTHSAMKYAMITTPIIIRDRIRL